MRSQRGKNSRRIQSHVTEHSEEPVQDLLLGLPDAGPKREEKRRLELKVADYRVKKTTLFKKYETAKANMENELLWFHTELSKSLGVRCDCLS